MDYKCVCFIITHSPLVLLTRLPFYNVVMCETKDGPVVTMSQLDAEQITPSPSPIRGNYPVMARLITALFMYFSSQTPRL